MRFSAMAWMVVLGSGGCAAANTPGPVESIPPAPIASSDPSPADDVTENEASSAATVTASEPRPPARPVDPLLSDQTVWETTDLGVAVPAGWQTCAGPEDCQLVVTTCCDHCNGGKAVSVAKEHVADVLAKYRRTGCGACTKRGCAHRAACEAGRCVMQAPKAP